jgi:ADP-ribosylglycohydrolase
VGDALGAPLEFMSMDEILERFGPEGPSSYEPAYGRRGAITDDTQMTLFTAEGLIRAHTRFIAKGICSTPHVLHHAYLRWLFTQDGTTQASWKDGRPDGWLVGVPGLNARRAPGNTCLGALQSGQIGTLREPINNSKGCGGVMRVAPIGLVANEPFRLGCEAAAITHGHPTGWLAAGFFAHAIAWLVAGEPLPEAVRAARAELVRQEGQAECIKAVDGAITLAGAKKATYPEVSSLGQGWVAEEAVAIAILAALVARDFEHGVRLAVTHGGDSDSTGCLAGQLLGTLLGVQAIPARWLDSLELRDVIQTVADDLWCCFRTDYDEESGYDWERYPGW